MTDDAPPPPDAPEAPIGRGRRIAIRSLLCGATVVAVLAIFATWANRQVLNADNWSDTSAEMLNNSEVRTQVSTYLVDQVYATADVSGQVAAALPPRLKPLAGPATNSLRDLA